MAHRRCLSLVLVILFALGLPMLVPQAASMAVPPVLEEAPPRSLPIVPEPLSFDLRPPTALGHSTTALPQVIAGGNTTCVINAAGQLYCWGAWSGIPEDLGLVSQVSVGRLHTCAVTEAGAVRCWGDNKNGQATVPADLGAVSQVSAGDKHTCAVTAGGTLRCWGWNDYGQVTVPDDLGAVSQVSAGGSHTCALTAGGTLRCWGRNDDGQATVPADLGAVSQVSAGGSHTCAVTTDGALRCWGWNEYDQATVPGGLGLVRQVSAGTWHTCAVTVAGALRCWESNRAGDQAVVPDNLGVVSEVSAGERHTCAVTTGGSVRCWGYNGNGQATVPGDLGLLGEFGTGSYHTCAVMTTGALSCWGNNWYGQAVVPGDLGTVAQVSLGYYHTCAVTTGGSVRCWGDNQYGQANVPSGLGVVRQVSAGTWHTCVVTTGGSVRCWGDNRYGQAVVPDDLGTVVQVSLGYYHTCAVTTGGSVRCWGDNQYGQGNVPSGLGAVSQVSAGAYHTCAVTTGGSVRCWGHNGCGQTMVPHDLGMVSHVSLGWAHTCAVTDNGTLRCWGQNIDGQAMVPVDLGMVSHVSLGWLHTCAVTASGMPRCWGQNIYGQTTVPRDPMTVRMATVTGRVTLPGGGLAGVELSEGVQTTVTDASGFYTLTDVLQRPITLTPSLAGYRFTPEARTLVLKSDRSGQDFVAEQGEGFTIQGRVILDHRGLPEVRITDGIRSAGTDATGAYTLTDVPSGTWTLTPTLAGYTFTPTTQTITVTGDLDGQDFTATLLTFPVMGRVTVDGVGLADVVISDGTRSATTDSTGAYTLTDVPYGTHVLTPTLAGYTFTPATRSVTVTAALTGQDFLAQAATLLTFPVTGRVTVDGVALADVVITDGTRSATTDSTGAYTLTDVPCGTHVLTPTLAGYTFTPATRSVTVTAALTGQDFLAQAATLLTFPVTGRVTVDGVALADVVITDGTRNATTDSTGAYTLTDVSYGTHVLTPTLAGYIFTPTTRTISVTEALRDQDFAATLRTFPVTGRVTVDGVGLAEVVITDGTRTVTTTDTGFYVLMSVPYGTHMLTPTLARYTFSPATRMISVTEALSDQNFAATLRTFPVTGRVTVDGVGLADVLITDGTRRATTDSTGAYTLTDVPYGTHVLTPTLAGYTFTPTTRTISVTEALRDQDFAATLLTFPVTGRVTVDGVGLAEVVITDGTRNATSDSTGAYTLTDVPYGTHVLTPTLAGYTFTPTTRTISVTEALMGQDFTASATTGQIRGRVFTHRGGLAGVVITDGTRSATTDSTGVYTLTGVPQGTWTLTPTREGYAFTPATRTVTVTGDLEGQDFVAIPVVTVDPLLHVNYLDGAPGSTFVLSGLHFPAGARLQVQVNGVVLDPPFMADAAGRFTLLLTTPPEAAAGQYVVVVSTVPVAQERQVQPSRVVRQTAYELVTSGPAAVVRLPLDEVVAPERTVPASVEPLAEVPRVYLPLVRR
ncbi:hypothetical protein [Candidatus Chloroploca asiatica]|uniref:Uncharacterized protein n=1 Tax=Candidatus Chloroploca asiatica TaxID=1506545 RepID=A0A2H3KRZ8_9CHLR|nr:hypothetical protein [Candidatus Chloroploca asiatica]PDV98006.1 hypothetical protein A9Q02_16570 [Candidatus Chloroploca asiatica]